MLNLRNYLPAIFGTIVIVAILLYMPSNSNLDLLIKLFLIAATICYILMNKKNYFVADEAQFSQNGVTVLFDSKQIIIKGKTYDVKNIDSITVGPQKLLYTTSIFIHLDNFEKHEIIIQGQGEYKNFIQRLKLALSKAGKPDLVISPI